MSKRTIEGYLGALRPELRAEKVCDAALFFTAEDITVTCSHSVQELSQTDSHTPADPERPAPFHFHLVI